MKNLWHRRGLWEKLACTSKNVCKINISDHACAVHYTGQEVKSFIVSRRQNKQFQTVRRHCSTNGYKYARIFILSSSFLLFYVSTHHAKIHTRTYTNSNTHFLILSIYNRRNYIYAYDALTLYVYILKLEYIGVYTDFDVNDSYTVVQYSAGIFFFFFQWQVVYLRDISHRGRRSLAVLKNVPADGRTLYFLCRQQKHGLLYKKAFLYEP